jgi:hypothetical protein
MAWTTVKEGMDMILHFFHPKSLVDTIIFHQPDNLDIEELWGLIRMCEYIKKVDGRYYTDEIKNRHEAYKKKMLELDPASTFHLIVI